MLEKFFKRAKKIEPDEIEPHVLFGRYSDNNKSIKKVDQWNEADALFKDKKFHESISVFFKYLKDESVENVVHKETKKGGEFHFYQGSKIIKGIYTHEIFKAEVVLALMPQP
jgi:hypothetical protein